MKTYSLPVERRFLSRSECLAEGRRIIREGYIECMTYRQIAREIYFHTLVYYVCDRYNIAPRLREHADPIDLCDDGDTRLRRAAFAASWMIPVIRSRRKK